MKTIFGSTVAAFVIAITLWSCGGKDKTTSTASSAAERKPIISIAELMIEKITSSNDTTKNLTHAIKILRRYDHLLYKALLDSPNSVTTKYFYSRRGSCCPCSAGGTTCCRCSSGSALGVATSGISQSKGIEGQGRLFMLAKMSTPPQVHPTLQFDSTIIDGMKIFTVPTNTRAGIYQVSFKGNAIDLTLVIEIDADGSIEISDLQ